jgi:hypothetical protein
MEIPEITPQPPVAMPLKPSKGAFSNRRELIHGFLGIKPKMQQGI